VKNWKNQTKTNKPNQTNTNKHKQTQTYLVDWGFGRIVVELHDELVRYFVVVRHELLLDLLADATAEMPQAFVLLQILVLRVHALLLAPNHEHLVP
jgi:hypothetical protein